MMEKEQRKRHPEKGMHGYFSWEKKKRIGIVILMYSAHCDPRDSSGGEVDGQYDHGASAEAIFAGGV